MRSYEIWQEGAVIQGGSFPHSFVGHSDGEDFRDAVLRYYEENPSPSFDPEQLSVWGCGLYDNEEDAARLYNDWLRNTIKSDYINSKKPVQKRDLSDLYLSAEALEDMRAWINE